MTQVVITQEQNQIVVSEQDETIVVASPSYAVGLEIWQPGMAPGGKTNDILVKSSDQDYDSEWTDEPIVDKLRFDLAAAETAAEGQLSWNVDERTLDLGKGNDVTLQIGSEQLMLCRNSTASQIPNGTAVMFAGTLGNSGRLLVAPMVANGTYPGYVFFGITTQAIDAGADGFVATFGKVRKVDTRAFAEGDVLWCDPVVPGGFTNVEPQAPNLKLPVAAVISSTTNGIIFVRTDTGRRLQDLHDVEANGSKNDEDILHWNASASRWETSDRLTLLEARVAALEAII